MLLLLYIIVFKGKEAIRFADSQSIIQKSETRQVYERDVSLHVDLFSAYLPGKNGQFFKIVHVLLIRTILESLTVTIFQLASGIFGKVCLDINSCLN